ncbi:MAG: hypothetical protein LBD67_02580 [Candidatus Accumulibacter sp.]|nr:hypothetical protein [Accumulibacter sp.]
MKPKSSTIHGKRVFSSSVLSLSKYERTLCLSNPYPSTGSGRTDWKDKPPSTRFFRQAKDRTGERTGTVSFDRPVQDGTKRLDAWA